MSRLQIVTLSLLLICHTALARLSLSRIDTDAAQPKDNNRGSNESERTLDALVKEDAKSFFRFLSAGSDGSKSASFSMSFSMATSAQVSSPTTPKMTAPDSVLSSSSPVSPGTPTVTPLVGGADTDKSTKLPGRTTTKNLRNPSMSPTTASPVVGSSPSTTSSTLSPSATPTADSTSSVTDNESLDHSENPSDMDDIDGVGLAIHYMYLLAAVIVLLKITDA